MKSKKNSFFLVIIAILSSVTFVIYRKVFSVNVLEETSIYISKKDDLESVFTKVEPYLKNPKLFKIAAQLKKYQTPKSGRYVITKNMSINEIINLLRSGRQTAVNVSFNNQHTIQQLAGRIAQQLEIDSITLLESFKEASFLKENSLDTLSVLQIFIPNSYQCYWDISAENFRNKMLREYEVFWNTNRLSKAKALGLSPKEVITLASIVHKETSKADERPIVAGLYLNRIKRNIPLQADPTVIFASKLKFGQDFTIKRVLNKDLQIESPYNTYLNAGLPPSLIGMPDINAIDAVLNPKQHNYIYMCASIDKIGYHEFAETLSKHNQNAAKYQQWLNKKGVFR